MPENFPLGHNGPNYAETLFLEGGGVSAFVALCIFPRLINHARGIVFVVLLCVVVQGVHRLKTGYITK